MRIYISGGCKNGKSTYGEKIAKVMRKPDYPLYYVATMNPKDTEDEERIKRHQDSRKGMGFETIEIGQDIRKLADCCNTKGCFLIDSTTALLANEMFLEDGTIHLNGFKKVAEDMCYLLNIIDDIVIVSDYIFSDGNLYDRETNDYRKGLAYIDQRCASLSDAVLESCYGNLSIYKGRDGFEQIYKKII